MQEYAPAEPIPPTHDYAGSNSERQRVGLPGHCKRCAEDGHIAAHPDLGCGDVDCNRDHVDGQETAMTDTADATPGRDLNISPTQLPPDVFALTYAAHRHPDDEPEAAHDGCADCGSWDLRRMCPDCIYYALS